MNYREMLQTGRFIVVMKALSKLASVSNDLIRLLRLTVNQAKLRLQTEMLEDANKTATMRYVPLGMSLIVKQARKYHSLTFIRHRRRYLSLELYSTLPWRTAVNSSSPASSRSIGALYFLTYSLACM